MKIMEIMKNHENHKSLTRSAFSLKEMAIFFKIALIKNHQKLLKSFKNNEQSWKIMKNHKNNHEKSWKIIIIAQRVFL